MTTSPALHPVRQVIRRTGLSADLLRAWERRYAAVVPARTSGGQRLYSDDDIERLVLLRRLTQQGHAIGQVATLATPRLREMLVADSLGAGADRGVGDAGATGDTRFAALEREAMGHVERLDGQGLEALLRRLTQHEGITPIIEAVIVPLMREVGERWHRREFTPAHEHLATSVIERTLHWMLDGVVEPADAPRIALATTQGERHEVGIQVAATIAAVEGWRPIYLGADLPAIAIAEATLGAGARVLALSVASPATTSLAELRQIREALPARIAVVLGGAGAASLVGHLPPGISDLSGLTAFRAYLRSFEVATG